MIRTFCLLLVFLVLPTLVWGQAQVINGNRVHAGWVNYGTTAGTASAYTLTFAPALPGYVQGQCFLLKPHLTNTGAGDPECPGQRRVVPHEAQRWEPRPAGGGGSPRGSPGDGVPRWDGTATHGRRPGCQ